MVSFEELGQEFAPGRVRVEVSLRGSDGALVAARRQAVTLSGFHPNGKACDGDGFVSGSLELQAGDRW